MPQKEPVLEDYISNAQTNSPRWRPELELGEGKPNKIHFLDREYGL